MIGLVKYFLAVFQPEQIMLYVDSTFFILCLYASLSDCLCRKTKLFSHVNLFHCHSEPLHHWNYITITLLAMDVIFDKNTEGKTSKIK